MKKNNKNIPSLVMVKFDSIRKRKEFTRFLKNIHKIYDGGKMPNGFKWHELEII